MSQASMGAASELAGSLAREDYAGARALLRDDDVLGRGAIALGLGEGNPLEVLRSAELAADTAAGVASLSALELALRVALRCRLERRAEQLVERIQAAAAGSARARLAEGRVALVFDARERARPALAAAHELDPDWLPARRGLAELEYIEGRFERALALLAPYLERAQAWSDPELGAAAALRMLAACHGARGAHREEANVLARLLEHTPQGANRERDQLQLVFAYAGAEDYTAAGAALDALWRGDPDGGYGRYARRRLDHLESSAALGQSSRRLEQFPTTHQKRNFCGPAVLELCLRYLGIELSQDEIAGVVKRESGTPMFEIGAFLAARDILARRVEATPERLRAAIDLGAPVIVQEEYSSTSHVAVITGYDVRLGAFIAQDPMTHRHELKAYEWTERAGQLFGNGGVVVIGRRAQVSEAQLAAFDRAGLVEQPHLTILDDADRRRAAVGGEQTEALAEEVIAAAERALASAPDYPLAWSRRAWSMFSRWQALGNQASRRELLSVLERARSRFRGHEWAHRLHACFLRAEGRYREAYVELLQAHRDDPRDGTNLDEMADCLRRVGELAEAERRFAQALECDPTHLSATEHLAALYVTQLGLLTPGPWYADDRSEWVPAPEPDAASQPLEHGLAEVSARAHFYVALALEAAPDDVFAHLQSALLAAADQDFALARERFARCCELREHAYTRGLTTRAAWLAGDLDAAATSASLLCERHPTSPEGWLWRAALARRAGEDARAFDTLCEGVQRVGPERKQLVWALWRAGLRFGGSEAAAVRLREVVKSAPHDPGFVRAVADRVEAASQRGIAIELLREVLQLTPGDINVRYRLGSLLSLDTTTRDEARELLTQVVQLAPHSPVARLGLAWTFHEDAPAQGLAVLEPCLAALDQAGPELLEAAGVLACASGDHARGAELRERAIGAYETPEQGRMALAQDHLDAMRYDLAAELVLPLRDADLGADTLSLQGLLLCACRMSGRQLELHAWVREHSRERVPDHLAFETFQAYRNADPELAARASDVLAQNATSQAGALEARIHAAGCRAVLGRPAELEALTQQIGDNGPAWALVYFAWVDAKRFDRAAEAAARAHALAPFDLQALSAWEGHCLRLGDKAGALGAAQSALEHHPYQHLGNERLAQLYARELNAEAALAHSRRAVMLAPYCHIAQTAHALALFAADDFERARAHAERAVAIEALEPGRWSEALSLLHALRGEHEALEQQLEARAREEPRWPFPELDAKLRAVCDAAARV